MGEEEKQCCARGDGGMIRAEVAGRGVKTSRLSTHSPSSGAAGSPELPPYHTDTRLDWREEYTCTCTCT